VVDRFNQTGGLDLQHLVEVHRESFAQARPRVATAEPVPDRDAVYRHFEQHALRDVGRFDRAGRARMRQAAAEYTELWMASKRAEAEAQRAAQQAGFDDQWRRLVDNDEDTVQGVLSAAFEAVPGYAPVGAVHLDKDTVGLALAAAADNVLPAELAGAQRARLYEAMVKSHALAAVKHAFALAPGLTSAQVVVVRHDFRRPCVLAFAVSRAALESVRWDVASPGEIVAAAASRVLARPEGVFGDLGPVDDLLDEMSADLAATVRDALASMVAGEGLAEGGAPAGFAVVDVETSGLSAEYDRMVEIAVVGTDRAGNVVDEWTTLVNPDGPVGKTSIHGIMAADVADAPRFRDIVRELTQRLAGRVIVGHNLQFDLRFLHAEYARARLRLPEVETLCTYRESYSYLPGLGRRRLTDCCHAAGVVLDNAHAALEDARATAGLLRVYLGSGTGLANFHRQLPDKAARVGWPQVYSSAAAIKVRAPAIPPAIPAPAGALAALLDGLEVDDLLQDGAPQSAAGYVEILADALEDGILTEEEAAALAEHARFAGLTRADVDAAHGEFLLMLARTAVADGRVTAEERRELNSAAAILGIPDKAVKRLLDEADSEWVARLSRDCRPLPDGWDYGEPLRVGQKVAFTGGEPVRRARLEITAQAAGLRVMNNVSRLTALLVTPEKRPDSRKGEAAFKHGTRMVRPGVFERMLAYVQPAPSQVGGQRPAGAITPRTTELGEGALGVPASPSVIRAWARENGYVVGPRGRLSEDVQTAFLIANETGT
jgi:DNA polymerase-3 subunit epsilon